MSEPDSDTVASLRSKLALRIGAIVEKHIHAAEMEERQHLERMEPYDPREIVLRHSTAMLADMQREIERTVVVALAREAVANMLSSPEFKKQSDRIE